MTFSRLSHFILYHMTQLAWLVVLLLFFFSLNFVDPYDHFAACCVPLLNNGDAQGGCEKYSEPGPRCGD